MSDAIRVRVAALMVVDGLVLLARHRKGKNAYHLLPGGGVAKGESLHEALIREVREETGLEVTIGRLLFINDTIDPGGRRHVLNITFAADVVGGELTPSPDDPGVEAIDLAEPRALLSMDLRPPIAERLLEVLSGDAPCEARYLGPLWARENNPKTGPG